MATSSPSSTPGGMPTRRPARSSSTSDGAWTSTLTARSSSTRSSWPASSISYALEHAHDGEARFGDPDAQSGNEFGLTIRLKEGTGMLDRFLADSVAARLSFEMIEVDRGFVRDPLAQFAAIVEAFPVRGDITAD